MSELRSFKEGDHTFYLLARTIDPPTDVFDCACGERRRYMRDAVGPDSLLPEPRGGGPQAALDWTRIERHSSFALERSPS